MDEVEKSALAKHEVAVLLPEGDHLDTATLHLLPKDRVEQAAVEEDGQVKYSAEWLGSGGSDCVAGEVRENLLDGGDQARGQHLDWGQAGQERREARNVWQF